MTQDTYIAPNLIDQAAKMGACDETLAWLRKEPRTVDQAVDRYPEWWLQRAADRLTD